MNNYKHYRQRGGTLERGEARSVWRHFCQYTSDRILDGEEVGIYRLGTFRIVGSTYRPTRSGINWQSTRKMWEENPELKGIQFVRYLNDHSSGVWYSVRWKPYISSAKTFKSTTVGAFRQRLSNEIKNGREYINS